MAIYRYVSKSLFFALLISNMVNSMEKKEEILKDLGLDTNNGYDDLTVRFPNSPDVREGSTLKLDVVKVKPEVPFEYLIDFKFYTLVMVDPDAPSRRNPVAAE